MTATAVRFLLAAGALTPGIPVGAESVAFPQNTGRIVLWSNGPGEYASTRLYLHGPDWKQRWSGEAGDLSDTRGPTWREIAGDLAVPGNPPGTVIRFRQRYTVIKDGFEVSVEFEAPKAARLNACSFSLFTKTGTVLGRSCRIWGTGKESSTVTVPAGKTQLQLWTGPARRINVPLPDPVSVRIEPPDSLLVQDNRFFDLDTVEFRFNSITGGRVPVGWKVKHRYTFRFREPVRVLLDENAPAGDDTDGWIPWTCPWDAAPVNVSFLVERPAGRHGFLRVRDAGFVFADGTPIRFWGTTLSAAANFPDKAQAPKIAERLARFGINMVRTHHADAQWASRSLIDYKRGDSRHFDEENLDRFDFFMAELKKRGIYVYLDQLVNRQFLDGDGVANAAKLDAAAKPYALFDGRLIELQKEYSRRLWTHINPYTGLAPRDDPQYVLAEFTNENDLFSQPVTLEPYRSQLEERFRTWAEQKHVRIPRKPIDFTRSTDAVVRFFVSVQEQYYRDMTQFFRKRLKVRIPLTGSNWSRNSSLLLALKNTCDYTDSHAYEDHPHGEKHKRIYNSLTSRKRRNLLAGLAFNCLSDRPFFVSEWDQPWPNEWRAELPLLMAAAGRFQDWAGLTVYTYRHDAAALDYVNGAFETGLDPARFGLFPHAALLFHRDVQPAEKTLVVRLDPARAVSTRATAPWGDGARAFVGTPEQHRVRVTFAADAEGDWTVAPTKQFGNPFSAVFASDTGELRRNWRRGYGTIDTAGTQAAYGLLGEQKEIKLKDVEFTLETRFATVALSSLTFLPIENSNRLLLTAVGRVRNTGMVYNLTHTALVHAGTAPMLLEPVVGEIRLHTPLDTLRVYVIGPRGERREQLRSEWKDGVLHFRIGDPPLSPRYLLTSSG